MADEYKNKGISIFNGLEPLRYGVSAMPDNYKIAGETVQVQAYYSANT